MNKQERSVACKVTLLLIAASLICACTRYAPNTPQVDAPSETTEINVAAAANLTEAFAEVARQFTDATKVRVVYSFGATADLEKQIENGAPFDVFAAADVEHINQLENKSLLAPETRHVYARGRLALWIPSGSAIQISNLEDLTRAEVTRIAVAKPDVAPYGRAAIEALRALNLWPQLEPKVVYAQNVAQAKQFAATGNVEAAFVPVALIKPNEGRRIEVDERLHQPIDQALAVIKTSDKQDAARRFTEFVLSDKGQAILERFGYDRPAK